jgi:branched-chain amino acid transport system ATP-binding protein
MLSVRNLHAAYGSIVALRRVTLDVRPGEIVSVVGPNGAGKSTLLAALAGGMRISDGAIEFDGERIDGHRPEEIVRRGISLVPEGRRIFSSLTVEENLLLGATVRPMNDETRAALEELKDLFPILRARSGLRAGQLSGGEQQMLGIARALIAEPRLLMLDEPSLGLAPAVTNQIFEVLKQLRERGATILLVEQHARRAIELSDRTYVLAHGVIEASGTSRELMEDAGFGRAYFGSERFRVGG